MTWISLLLPLTFRQRGNTFCGSRLRRCPVAMAPQSPSFSRNVAPPQTIPLLGRQAERAFEAVRNLEPYRMWDMEVYSTLLWHLQRNVKLSFLAQELLSIDPRAPQAWIAVGNCFSLQKERVQALTCFHRSAQLDPTCAYAYTLSGHETIDDDSDKAITFFQAALRADPRHYNAWCVCESVAFYPFVTLQLAPPVPSRVAWSGREASYDHARGSATSQKAIACLSRGPGSSSLSFFIRPPVCPSICPTAGPVLLLLIPFSF